MKLRQTIIGLLVVLATSLSVFAQWERNTSPLPAPTGMVNDYANIIDDSVEAQIEQKLRDFKAKTNPPIEIAVVTVKTTGDRPIFDYSLAIARGWKIGEKGATNSSALLLIAVDDRKYFTQVSGGLQDELTDGIVGQLQRQYLVPAFRQGNYTKGINDTIDAYIKTIEDRASGTTDNQPQTPQKSRGKSFSPYTLICLVVIILFLIIIFSGSGGGGNGGGGSSNRRSGDITRSRQSDRWRSGGFGGNTSNSSTPPIIFWGGGSSSSSDWGGSSGDSGWGGFGGGGGGWDGGGAGGDW